MPLDVEVTYQIKQLKDGAGVEVTEEYKKGNSATNAGVYLVKVSFTIMGKNADNYIAAPYEKEAYLTILRAPYDEQMQGLYLDSRWYVFEEGKTYEIDFTGDLPDGVSPNFTLTNKQGEKVEGTMILVESEEGETAEKTTYQYLFTAETAGEYTCTITFTHSNKNYADITLTLTAVVFIHEES